MRGVNRDISKPKDYRLGVNEEDEYYEQVQKKRAPIPAQHSAFLSDINDYRQMEIEDNEFNAKDPVKYLD